MSKDNTNKKQYIKIRTDVVRDENITANDFAIILYLKYMTWKTGGKYRFEVLLSELKSFLNVADNKSLKPIYTSLYNNEYIIEPMKPLKPNTPILFVLNKNKFNTDDLSGDEFFTHLPISILFGLKDGKIDKKEVRILYYLKSYINYTDSKKHFCYTGIEKTMTRELNMSEKTIPKYTKSLVDKKLINIERHVFKTEYQYDENGKLLFNKFNNHYYINYENIVDL
jgi:predicted transcriptional regulator